MAAGDSTTGFARWLLVATAAAALGLAGTYQFLWSSIRDPLAVRIAVSEAQVGTIFSLFVVFQTVSQFPAGWVRDRYGPRLPTLLGAVLVAVGFAGVATADGLLPAAASYALGGVGVGATYTVAMNTPVKWLRERRGLGTGVVGMSYGGASVFLIPLVRGRIDASFATTLLGLGALAGVVVLTAAIVLRDPPKTAGTERAADGGDREPRRRTGASSTGSSPDRESPATGRGAPAVPPTTWRDVVRTRQFWLLYVVFVAVNGVGLMVIGKVVTYTGRLGLSVAVGTAVASLVALADAGGVVAGGAASDRYGRVPTVAASLVACGGALALGVAAGEAGIGVGFLALVTAAAFFRTPAFSVFPTLVGEYWGESRSSENYAVLYTAKLWGGLGGGVVASVLVATVGWTPTFLGGAVVVAGAGLLTTRLRPVDPAG